MNSFLSSKRTSIIARAILKQDSENRAKSKFVTARGLEVTVPMGTKVEYMDEEGNRFKAVLTKDTFIRKDNCCYESIRVHDIQRMP